MWQNNSKTVKVYNFIGSVRLQQCIRIMMWTMQFSTSQSSSIACLWNCIEHPIFIKLRQFWIAFDFFFCVISTKLIVEYIFKRYIRQLTTYIQWQFDYTIYDTANDDVSLENINNGQKKTHWKESNLDSSLHNFLFRHEKIKMKTVIWFLFENVNPKITCIDFVAVIVIQPFFFFSFRFVGLKLSSKMWAHAI